MTSLILLILFAAPAPSEPVLIDKIAAIVNDEIITFSDVQATAEPFLAQNPTKQKREKLFRDIMEQLIDEKLIAQQVKEAKINVTSSDLEQAIEQIIRQNGLTREQLVEAVTSRGMSYEEYQADVKQQLIRLKLIDMKVRSRVIVPESELRAEYEVRIRREKPQAQVKLAHIMLRFDQGSLEEDRQRVLLEAQTARKRVTDDGEPFGEVAKELSQGPTASEGGELREMAETTLLPELGKAVASLEPGDISPPVITPNGIHVIKLLSRRTEPSKTFEEMRPAIYEDVYQRRAEEQMKVWLDEIRRQSAVDIRLD